MEADRRQLNRIHVLLTVQSAIVVLLSFNRLGGITRGYVAPNQFLRWVDLLNMLVLPLASVLATYLLRIVLAYDSPARGGRAHRLLGGVFVVGVYLLAGGYAAHEVTNYLHERFCPQLDSRLCEIIAYNDDEFSHLVFFIGFILLNVSVLVLPLLFPARRLAYGRDLVGLGANAVVFGAGIFANLAFEEIGLDLYVVAVVALVAAGLWWPRRREPVLVYYLLTYWLGLIATAGYKLLAR